MDAEEVYRKFKETKQEAVRLDMALQGFFQDAAEKEKDREVHREAYSRYLKLRIRPAMELLIKREDLDKIEQLEIQGWFGAQELEGFLRLAREQGKTSILMWLLHLKKEKYGFQEKDFSL